jgi:hypothetical protein
MEKPLLSSEDLSDLGDLLTEEEIAPPVKPLLERPTAEQRIVALMVANNVSDSLICQQLDIEPEELEEAKSDEKFFDLILDFQAHLDFPVEEQIKRAADEAFLVKYKLMHTSKNETLRDKIATWMMEQVTGKAIQRVESIGLNMNVTASQEELDKNINLSSRRLQALQEERNKLLAAQKAS